MLLTVLIPVYNEESTIAEVLERVALVDLGPGVEKEIVVVDDGSTDQTAEILRARRASVKHVHESRVNMGKGTAVRIGLTYAQGDIVIVQDADLELDPNEYGQLLQPILRGETNVVFGTRFGGPPRPMIPIPVRTVIANHFLTGVTNVLYGTRLTDMATAYKVMRREVALKMRIEARGFEFEPEVTAKLARLGERIVEVPISYRPRTADEGKKIRWQHGLLYLWCLLKYRFVPVAWMVREAPQPRPVVRA